MQENIDALVKLRLLTYNQRLVQCRKEKNLTQAELSLLTGIHASHISQIELLKLYPTVDEAEEIASALDKPREWLFPAELIPFRTVERIRHLTPEQAKNLSWIQPKLLPSPQESFDHQSGLSSQLKEVLSTLQEKEQRVLTLHFGLEDGCSRTLEEVGRELGVTRERIRQIEAKVLRKLRHPTRSRKLKDYLLE